MRRRTSLIVEPLEGRALLSGLSYSLTTDKSTYQVGEPVQMTFTETNTSDEPASFIYGPSVDGFIVTQGGQTVWQSNSGANPMWVMNETLQPGQSWTIHSTWDGTLVNGSSTTTTTGSFVVTNQLDPSGASASFQIESPLSYSFNMPQTAFQFGQPINFSYTITNTSNQPFTFSLPPTDFTVAWYSNTVWESDPGASAQVPTTETLQPGQALTETATWNGVATEGTLAGTNVWEEFTVSIGGGPPGLTQEFQITSPLKQSVSTNQLTYQPGEPVQLTATETNTTAQAITILNTQDQFIVMGYGGVNLPATDLSSSNPVVTLQAGQSQTFTATWIPNGSEGSTGSSTGVSYYNVLFQDNFQGTTSPQFVVQYPPSDPTPPPDTTGPPTDPTTPPGTTGSTSDPTPPLGNTNPISVQLPGTPTSPTQNPSPVTAILTTNQSANHSGHPVRITLTLKNVTKKSERLTPHLSTDSIILLEGSTILSRTTRSLLTSKAKLLKPGHSLQVTSTWNGKPNQVGLKKLNPGIYTVEADQGGYTASAQIRIE
jgi:Intracellular proteinase inhibitor